VNIVEVDHGASKRAADPEQYPILHAIFDAHATGFLSRAEDISR
jgi:hypothetical protein